MENTFQNIIHYFGKYFNKNKLASCKVISTFHNSDYIVFQIILFAIGKIGVMTYLVAQSVEVARYDENKFRA